MTYSEQLKNPLWQKKRLRILERDGFTCQLCLDNETELHVHHTHYIKNKAPWEYADADLITYCKYCHLIVEEGKEDGSEYIAAVKVKRTDSIFTLIASKITNGYVSILLNVYKNEKLKDSVEIPHVLIEEMGSFAKDCKKLLSLNKREVNYG